MSTSSSQVGQCLLVWIGSALLLVQMADAAKDLRGRVFLNQDTNEREYKDKDEDERLYLKITNHESCPVEGMKIVFGDKNASSLIEDPKQDGCYLLKTQVMIYDELGNDMQIYVEKRNSLEETRPAPCEDYKENGCGGTGGACIHCKDCDEFELHQKEIKQDFSFKLTIDGEEPESCDGKLEPGLHDNIQLRFCLPSRNEYLRSQGFNPDTFTKILEATSDTDQDVFLHVYMFNFNLQSIISSTRALETQYRVSQNKPNDYPVPVGHWLNNTPMGKMIRDRKYIGCHTFVGQIGMKPLKSEKGRKQ